MEQFEQLLTCAICLDRYRNPKLLPCQHSFCMEPCMDGLVDYVRRQVKCPECRAEHRIPYQGVQAFPTNVTLQRFLELHIEITGELPDPTSGQTMERCGVCSEKSYCSLCVHCEKKCCPECKDAHMDILRREITRINSQVRRGLHRLQDALALVEKNTLGLQTNCASVGEEVDEIYRRLSKAVKDRTEQLRNEVDRYLGTELRGLIQLKENLELEIANIQSNCDLAEAHFNENVPWDDTELLDAKELFLRTVEFIRNFEYEAGDYARRVRFVMAHDPNQLVLHVAGYGELNIKPETGTGGLLGNSSGTLAPPGGSPGLMRSKSDHRLASQYRQPDDDRLSRNRYVPDYEYEAPEYEAPRNKSRYRSRFMRHRDGEDSDGDSRSTVRFTGTQDSSAARERVLDTEDAAKGPLSGIFRLTDSPRIMKKLQECEKAGKRKKEEPVQPQPSPLPKPQIQMKRTPTAMARQVSEDDEISRIKKQNKNVPATPEMVEERQPSVPLHLSLRDKQEREPEEVLRRTPMPRRTSTEGHTQGARSASSDSSTGSESSSGSGIRSTGAPFTAEEMKQKYLSKAPATNTTTSTVSSGTGGLASTANRESPTTTTSSPRPFQSRFLGAGNRTAPAPPPVTQIPAREELKKKEEEDDDDETTSSSEETESETDEESETETRPSTTAPSATTQERRSESAMARTDIGPLLARSAEARRGSKEDSPSARYSTPRGSPAQTTTPTTTSMTSPGGYTSSRDSGHDIIDNGFQSISSGIVIDNPTDNLESDLRNKVELKENEEKHNSITIAYPESKRESESNNSKFHLEDRVISEELVRVMNGEETENGDLLDRTLRPIMESTNEEESEESEDVKVENKKYSRAKRVEINRMPEIMINNKSSLKTEEEDGNHTKENGPKKSNPSSVSESEEEESGRSAHTLETILEDTGQSILKEKIGEESLLDNNGWVVKEEDSTVKKAFSKFFLTTGESKESDEENDERNDESISNSDNPRSRIYGQSSIGNNGWMTSDESEGETDGTVSSMLPVDNSRMEEEININVAGRQNSIEECSIGDEGWVILDKDSKKTSNDRVDQVLNGNEIFKRENIFRTTDPVGDESGDNDALMMNASQNNMNEETPESNMSVPMQMVTTVLCVSVLFYSVLFNLFM